MNLWRNLVTRLVGILRRIGGAALVGMMVMTCFDVITRYFGHPIFGAVEIVAFLATIVLACAMPLTQVEKGHVGVDLLIRRLSPRTQNIVDSVTSLLSFVLFALVSWQMFLYAAALRASGEVSMSLEFPTHIIVTIVAVAFGVLSLVILYEFIDKVRRIAQP